MIELNKSNFKIQKIEKDNKASSNNTPSKLEVLTRPEVVDAKVYKLKSAFVKNSVFVTLSYTLEDGKIRPVEIFINSKDLSRSHEYVILTRLISAVFRRGADVMFILEELQGILDPEGGRFKEGNYYHSLYAEIAEVIQNFFYDVGILDKKQESQEPSDYEKEENKLERIAVPKVDSTKNNMSQEEINVNFRICPSCNQKGLKTENGCDVCIVCGYSKCDK